MNKRSRKKWLKKNNLYIPEEDTWSLDYTIAKFIIPRLKKFKNETNGYPAMTKDVKTFEDWQNVLDKIIHGFEMSMALSDNDWWIDNPEYDYIKLAESKGIEWFPANDRPDDPEIEAMKQKLWAREAEMREEARDGLQLFADYFRDLWW